MPDIQSPKEPLDAKPIVKPVLKTPKAKASLLQQKADISPVHEPTGPEHNVVPYCIAGAILSAYFVCAFGKIFYTVICIKGETGILRAASIISSSSGNMMNNCGPFLNIILVLLIIIVSYKVIQNAILTDRRPEAYNTYKTGMVFWACMLYFNIQTWIHPMKMAKRLGSDYGTVAFLFIFGIALFCSFFHLSTMNKATNTLALSKQKKRIPVVVWWWTVFYLIALATYLGYFMIRSGTPEEIIGVLKLQVSLTFLYNLLTIAFFLYTAYATSGIYCYKIPGTAAPEPEPAPEPAPAAPVPSPVPAGPPAVPPPPAVNAVPAPAPIPTPAVAPAPYPETVPVMPPAPVNVPPVTPVPSPGTVPVIPPAPVNVPPVTPAPYPETVPVIPPAAVYQASQAYQPAPYHPLYESAITPGAKPQPAFQPRLEPAPQEKRSIAPTLCVVVIILLLLGGGGGVWYYMHQEDVKQAKREKANEERMQESQAQLERKKQELEEQLSREEAERKAREEAERKRMEEEARLAREEAERKAAQEEAERKRKEEEARLAREKEERKLKEEAERLARKEAELKAWEEEEEAARKRREEEEQASIAPRAAKQFVQDFIGSGNSGCNGRPQSQFIHFPATIVGEKWNTAEALEKSDAKFHQRWPQREYTCQSIDVTDLGGNEFRVTATVHCDLVKHDGTHVIIVTDNTYIVKKFPGEGFKITYAHENIRSKETL